MFGLEPLVGAYGRTYNSLKAMQEDFDKGLDFRCASGRYANKEDLKDFAEVTVRYGKDFRKVGRLKCR